MIKRFTRPERLLALIESRWALIDAAADRYKPPDGRGVAALADASPSPTQAPSQLGSTRCRGSSPLSAAPHDSRQEEYDDDAPPFGPWRLVLECDPLAVLDPDRMAGLATEQREHALAVNEAHSEALRIAGGRAAAQQARRAGATWTGCFCRRRCRLRLEATGSRLLGYDLSRGIRDSDVLATRGRGSRRTRT